MESRTKLLIMEEFMKQYKPGDTIDLGWENGWNDKAASLFWEIIKYEISGTRSRSGSASNQTIKRKILYNEQEYDVVHYLDSGD